MHHCRCSGREACFCMISYPPPPPVCISTLPALCLQAVYFPDKCGTNFHPSGAVPACPALPGHSCPTCTIPRRLPRLSLGSLGRALPRPQIRHLKGEPGGGVPVCPVEGAVDAPEYQTCVLLVRACEHDYIGACLQPGDGVARPQLLQQDPDRKSVV